ncbi:MAG: helix-turn-helix transcriptional regulator [Clostridia bacterium]|nr:helix-turn-helix transcriptional regulator [Clostridia bacterium]
MSGTKLKIDVLPSSRLFDERESGMVHTPYEIETAFYSSIGRGNVKEMKAMLRTFFESGIVTGKLSVNDFRQIQYWAVCCVAIATRYAIAGGADETFCYNFSDECIMKIDVMKTEQEILDYLVEKSIELTEIVGESKLSGYPKAVKKCLKIINNRLFGELSLSDIAFECGISKDHMSMIFKKYTGITIPQYIKKERLNASKELLKSGMSISQAAYTVGFSTESYFIKCFKDEFGITPAVFAKFK